MLGELNPMRRFPSLTKLSALLAASIGLNQGTVVASTSGTSIDFTIPAGAKRVSLSFFDVSTNGTNFFRVQLGSNGSVETTGYKGSRTGPANLSAGIDFYGNPVAAGTYTGRVELVLVDAATNTWSAVATASRTDVAETPPQPTVGSKALVGTLDKVRFTTVGSTDTFDAGKVNIQYQK